MRYSIHITKKAELDLISAADYIEFTLLNPTASNNLLCAAEEKINALTLNPKKHPIIDDTVLNALGIRFIVINSYMAFYIVDENTHTVHIVRFLYCKRNWLQILRNESPDLS